MHTYIYIYIYTYIYTYIHKYTCTYIYLFTHIHIYTYVYISACIYINVYMYIYIYMCMYIYAYMYTCIYKYIYIYTYIYIDTYICMHMYIYMRVLNPTGILACDLMPRIQSPTLDSPNSCYRSVKWAWYCPGGLYHTPLLQWRNGGFKGRANIVADKTHVQVQSAALTERADSVTPRPPPSPMPILLSANGNLKNPRPTVESLDHRPRSPAHV